MESLRPEVIGRLLVPFGVTTQPPLLDKLAVYLDLLLRWNARMNLTAIRDPETIVSRHFGESLFAARHVPEHGTLLDYGSGAGFPGVPAAIAQPGLVVTLAESQSKKASFLREVVRVLGLPVEVWPRRVEEMPLLRTFESVTLRAVDHMAASIAGASSRATTTMVLLTTNQQNPSHGRIPGFVQQQTIAIPRSEARIVAIWSRA